MNYNTAKEIEVAVAKHFGIRRNIIVPNVSWGFLTHEVDLLVVTGSGWAWEVEIEVSRQDLIRDQKKRHQHISQSIKRLWFAIPERLLRYSQDVPAKAGILVVREDGVVAEWRTGQANAYAHKLTGEDRLKILRLGVMRIWALKEKILKLSTAAAAASTHNPQTHDTS